LLFQSIALLPHLTAFDNLAFPLKRQKLTPAELRRRVGQIAELLRITHLLTRLPRTFSGGERQRVALGRAMIQPARLLLLDEPLSSLDARIRLELRNEFRRIHRQQEQTTIYVTHDPMEALSLADRVGILQEGNLVQVGSGRTVYESPINGFIAQQLGLIDLLRFEIVDSTDALWLPDASVKLDNVNAASPPSSAGLLGVRPEWVLVSSESKRETPWLATVETIEFSGHYSLVALRIGNVRLRARVTERRLLAKGKQVWAGVSRPPLYFESPQKDEPALNR
jgi:multiple sugar transport system ATP-binding protein